MTIQERVLEQLLSQFVDREAEMRRFCGMLDSDIKHIMLLCGESGSGKSWLLQKMMYECSQRSLRKAKVIWTDTSSYDYMWTMRAIRDDLGAGESSFQTFNDLINQYTDRTYSPSVSPQIVVNIGGPQTVLENASIKDANVGEIAHTIIKDNMFMIPRSDLNISVKELQLRLTGAFIKDLADLIGAKPDLPKIPPIVVFLDAAEKMSLDTEKWIWDELLRAVFEERLRNVKFIICGQRRHDVSPDWLITVEEAELQPLTKAHIMEYLERRGVNGDQTEMVAEWLLATTKGRIKDIAVQAEMYVRWRATQGIL